jgi:transposase
MLSEYKAQSGTERGFQFIKDNAFEVDSIFLKKPSRIHALMSIMCLCLMVYGFAQYQLRTCLQSTGETIPNQVGKKTSQPSMKWIFRLFHGIQVVTIQTAVFTQEIVINLKSITEKIIDYFGHKAKKIYGLAG